MRRLTFRWYSLYTKSVAEYCLSFAGLPLDKSQAAFCSY